MLVKMMKYLHGVLLALMGKYPHAELEQLNRIKAQIWLDDRWLSIHSGVRLLTERYINMLSPTWRQYAPVPIEQFRKELFTEIRNNPEVQHDTFVPCYDLANKNVNGEKHDAKSL